MPEYERLFSDSLTVKLTGSMETLQQQAAPEWPYYDRAPKDFEPLVVPPSLEREALALFQEDVREIVASEKEEALRGGSLSSWLKACVVESTLRNLPALYIPDFEGGADKIGEAAAHYYNRIVQDYAANSFFDNHSTAILEMAKEIAALPDSTIRIGAKTVGAKVQAKQEYGLLIAFPQHFSQRDYRRMNPKADQAGPALIYFSPSNCVTAGACQAFLEGDPKLNPVALSLKRFRQTSRDFAQFAFPLSADGPLRSWTYDHSKKSALAYLLPAAGKLGIAADPLAFPIPPSLLVSIAGRHQKKRVSFFRPHGSKSVWQGRLPENPEFFSGQRVMGAVEGMAGYLRTGTIRAVYQDGTLGIQWDRSKSIDRRLSILDIAVGVETVNGIVSEAKVFDRTGQFNVGTVSELFSNGTASVKWHDSRVARICRPRDLLRAVSSYDGFSAGDRVSVQARIREGFLVGEIKHVFEDGRCAVMWDDLPERCFDTMYTTRGLARVVGSNEGIAAGDTVVSTPGAFSESGCYVGRVAEVYANGAVAVRWGAGQGTDSRLAVHQVSKQAEEFEGLRAGVRVVSIVQTQEGQHISGTVLKVFRSGQLSIDFGKHGLSNSWDHTQVAVPVKEYGGYRPGTLIIKGPAAKYDTAIARCQVQTGSVAEVFDGGILAINWDYGGIESAFVSSAAAGKLVPRWDKFLPGMRVLLDDPGSQHYTIGLIAALYDNGLAVVYTGDKVYPQCTWPVQNLRREIIRHDGFYKGERVISTSKLRGTITSLFEGGLAWISCDEGGEACCSTVELAGLGKPIAAIAGGLYDLAVNKMAARLCSLAALLRQRTSPVMERVRAWQRYLEEKEIL